jgi:hypothetical protein
MLFVRYSVRQRVYRPSAVLPIRELANVENCKTVRMINAELTSEFCIINNVVFVSDVILALPWL